MSSTRIVSNASKGITRVRYEGVPKMKRINVDVTDINGSPIEGSIRLLEHAADAVEFAITNMRSGIFYLKIFDGKTSTTRKIILQ